MFPLLLCALFLDVLPGEAAPEKDEVFNLPGLSNPPSFRQFSGFLDVSGEKKLHYWFVESICIEKMAASMVRLKELLFPKFVECQDDPKSCPLVLWLNGGPGCSSLAGFLTEHGPFLTQPDGRTLKYNDHSWNKIANIIYLESPAGVGFSYSDCKNYTTGDAQTARDNYMALKDFFRLYPEFVENDFYITGESYGGFYVPSLAVEVEKDSSVNLKGLAIGNGITDSMLDFNSLPYFLYYHGLLDAKTWRRLENACCTKKVCNFVNSSEEACADVRDEAFTMAYTEKLNPYNLFQPCLEGKPGEIRDYGDHIKAYHPGTLSIQSHSEFSKRLKDVSQLNKPISMGVPCVNDTDLTTYLNNPDVRSALHIPHELPQWEICSSEVCKNYETELDNVHDQYLQLLKEKKYRIMVYSGDLDLACNFLGIEWFVNSLNLEVEEPYHPWMYHDGTQSQIAGFAKQFVSLTLLTVKGAGHMVPTDKPLEAFQLFKRFINNESF